METQTVNKATKEGEFNRRLRKIEAVNSRIIHYPEVFRTLLDEARKDFFDKMVDLALTNGFSYPAMRQIIEFWFGAESGC